MKTYKVVHFRPQLEHAFAGGAKGRPVEIQLQTMLNEHAAEGWELVDYETVHVNVKAGCIASLLGRRDEIIRHDVMIFAR